MKKILNDPQTYATDALRGLCRAFPQYYHRVDGHDRVIARADGPVKGKVGIVTGGGSGHLPIFTGYVGPGFLDACACGEVFASPSSDEIEAAMNAADGGAGVLALYGNYGGDVMNFDMAAELAGMDTGTVLLADDVASAPLAERAKRRGVAGMVPTFKIAGAAADAGLDLEGVAAVAQRAADGCRTMGVALTSCTVPQAGKPTFSIGESEMEIGMGIHGEPGIERGALATAGEIATRMIGPILEEIATGSSQRATILVNSLGATPVEELLILFDHFADALGGAGIEIVHPLVGRYATSMEMAGASVTVLPLDEELEAYLTRPARCAFWQVG
ncbi:dihydroxyacetone kinase subunit DhaK [Tropicimonas sp. IMCC34011]|uniref:dihydroxyacetone kinase subunit DhaK n=1 Tax=Tropicimonas sp. IMCC34011 TaxID=2248759 RepID=UPI000E234CAB|nr:dihydroxyacetone kinase subunit DhaK [Tropicimonas sp. IMCC34011]